MLTRIGAVAGSPAYERLAAALADVEPPFAVADLEVAVAGGRRQVGIDKEHDR